MGMFFNKIKVIMIFSINYQYLHYRESSHHTKTARTCIDIHKNSSLTWSKEICPRCYLVYPNEAAEVQVH